VCRWRGGWQPLHRGGQKSLEKQTSGKKTSTQKSRKDIQRCCGLFYGGESGKKKRPKGLAHLQRRGRKKSRSLKRGTVKNRGEKTRCLRKPTDTDAVGGLGSQPGSSRKKAMASIPRARHPAPEGRIPKREVCLGSWKKPTISRVGLTGRQYWGGRSMKPMLLEGGAAAGRSTKILDRYPKSPDQPLWQDVSNGKPLIRSSTTPTRRLEV